MDDIYFQENYGRLYEGVEGGKCETFELPGRSGTVRHMFIRREVPVKINGEVYYDLVTPYGYGGPVITRCEGGDRAALVKEFETEFNEYCRNNRIISEFVRFHPIVSNAQDFAACYNINFRRKTTGTNIAGFEDPVRSEFSKSAKTNIKKALKDGLEYRITLNPRCLRMFREFYYLTMSKNDAEAIYYFDDKYFSACLDYFGENLLLVEAIYEGKVVGMILNFVYRDMVHIHLSGTLEEYLHLSPVYLMLYGLTLWAKENGISLVHSGGGRGGDPDDKLYRFKRRFGKNTEFDYFVGQKIWNHDVYEQLCKATGMAGNKGYFPAYRQGPAAAAS